jgi:hypothetical protein
MRALLRPGKIARLLPAAYHPSLHKLLLALASPSSSLLIPVIVSFNMLRPRKALAAAPKQQARKREPQRTALSAVAATGQASLEHAAREFAQRADSAGNAASSNAQQQQQQQHPVDILYSSLISRLSTPASNSGLIAAAARSPPSASAAARKDARSHSFIHASAWALKQLQPTSAADAAAYPLSALGPPSPGKIETPAQQLKRREQRFGFIVDAVQTQLGNSSGRLHLSCRFISDAEFHYIVRAMPVAGLCQALVTRLVLDGNKITNVADVPWPASLTHLVLSNNLLTSLVGVSWPPHLRCLLLDCNAIHTASSSSASPPAAAAPPPPPPLPHASPPPSTPWPLHLTVLDLGRNKLSGHACVAPRRGRLCRISLPLFSYICRRCVRVLEELLPCRALEQVCVYNNCFDKLELFTALLALGYPQPAALQLQADMNAQPLVRFPCALTDTL